MVLPLSFIDLGAVDKGTLHAVWARGAHKSRHGCDGEVSRWHSGFYAPLRCLNSASQSR